MATKTKTTQPDLGLSASKVEEAVELLQTLLSDEYVLYTKLRKYHWNVTGPDFRSLHLLFEEQYETVEARIDATAERARTYGVPVIGTMEEFKDNARLKENPGDLPNAEGMIVKLAEDHEMLVRELRDDIKKAGEELEDSGLEDFLIATLQEHQNMSWFLRSFLG